MCGGGARHSGDPPGGSFDRRGLRSERRLAPRLVSASLERRCRLPIFRVGARPHPTIVIRSGAPFVRLTRARRAGLMGARRSSWHGAEPAKGSYQTIRRAPAIRRIAPCFLAVAAMEVIEGQTVALAEPQPAVPSAAQPRSPTKPAATAPPAAPAASCAGGGLAAVRTPPSRRKTRARNFSQIIRNLRALGSGVPVLSAHRSRRENARGLRCWKALERVSAIGPAWMRFFVCAPQT
jgi:hypothetical protein